MSDEEEEVKDERIQEIALLLEMRRWSKLGALHYMVSLQVAAEELKIPDEEMFDFCAAVLKHHLQKRELPMVKPKRERKTVVIPPPVMPLGLSEETQKHLLEGYRQVRTAYSFLTARNMLYAQEQLRAGLSNLDRALAPWAS